MSSYTRSIPQPTDLISNSQPQILGNFQTIDSGTTQTGIGFSRNHVTMTDSTNGGLHNRIDMFQNISAPTISGFVGSLYPADISSASELQYTNAGGSTQITSGSLPIWKGGTPGANGVATATAAQNGQLNLPNGIQFRWGFASGVNDGGSVSFTPAFSNNCFNVQLTLQRGNADVRSLSVNAITDNASFTIHTSAGGSNLYYFAIGN